MVTFNYTSCTWPIERADISDPCSHYLLILWAKLLKGGVHSPGAVNTVGICMPYDGMDFTDFPAVSEG